MREEIVEEGQKKGGGKESEISVSGSDVHGCSIVWKTRSVRDRWVVVIPLLPSRCSLEPQSSQSDVKSIGDMLSEGWSWQETGRGTVT